MKSGRSLEALAKELDRQRRSKKDVVLPSALIHHTTHDGGETEVLIEEPDAPHRYTVTPLARKQLAEKLKIPLAYFERMRNGQPALLDANVNTWLQADDGRNMLRTLDGRVRAVLSNRFRRIENYDLAEAILPVLGQYSDGRLESVELTENRMYLKYILPRLEYEMRPGDVVQAGIAITNSEVGLAQMVVQPLLYRLVCRNGLITVDPVLRQKHIGRPLGNDEEATIYQEDTLLADEKAFFLKVRDAAQWALSEATFHQYAAKMQRTMGIELVTSPVKTVEVLRQRYTLTEDEGDGVLRHLIKGGDLSGYGLVNAVTGFSQEVADYDRATEFEALGGKLIELSAGEWKELAEAG